MSIINITTDMPFQKEFTILYNGKPISFCKTIGLEINAQTLSMNKTEGNVALLLQLQQAGLLDNINLEE